MKTPYPTASSFVRNAGVGHHAIAVDEAQDGACQESAEDDLEPERLGESDEAGEEEEGAADADLRRRVLQPNEEIGQPHRALRPDQRERERADDEQESSEQHELRGRARRLAREEEREEDHGAEVGDRRRGDHELPEAGGSRPGVLEDGHDHAERRGDEDDRDEQRCLHLPEAVEGEREDKREPEGDGEAEGGDAHESATQPLELDLEPGEEEQEGEADE
jgi:hypothetical protein